MTPRTHAALGTTGVTNKQTCGQWQQGKRCQRNLGSYGSKLHRNKLRCPLLLLTAKHEQSAPPGHTTHGHGLCPDGDAFNTRILVRNLQEGMLAHHLHTCARTGILPEATPALFRPYTCPDTYFILKNLYTHIYITFINIYASFYIYTHICTDT